MRWKQPTAIDDEGNLDTLAAARMEISNLPAEKKQGNLTSDVQTIVYPSVSIVTWNHPPVLGKLIRSRDMKD
jgi:hypothetical protein